MGLCCLCGPCFPCVGALVVNGALSDSLEEYENPREAIRLRLGE